MKKSRALPAPFISGSVLKLLAMASMLVDHVALFLLCELPFCTDPLFTLFGKGCSLYTLCRLFGRLAFPLYCFLLTEGFLHTKNRKRYGVRLFVFALISELPWNFARTGTWLCPTQNVMFTLLFGYLALCALEYFEKDAYKQVAAVILLFLVCSFGRASYGAAGLGVILAIYLLRCHPLAQAVVSSCMLGTGWAAIFAFVPIRLYNQERGFMRGPAATYAAYLFYPAHLLLLGILKQSLFA